MNANEEMLTRWLDDELSADERAEFEARLAGDDELRAEAEALTAMRAALVSTPAEEMPHGEFFNSQLLRRIEREDAAVAETPIQTGTPVKWWQRMLLPAAFAGMAACFFLGLMLAPADTGVPNALVATVYSPTGDVTAEVIQNSQGPTVIVLDGLEAIPDSVEIAFTEAPAAPRPVSGPRVLAAGAYDALQVQ